MGGLLSRIIRVFRVTIPTAIIGFLVRIGVLRGAQNEQSSATSDPTVATRRAQEDITAPARTHRNSEAPAAQVLEAATAAPVVQSNTETATAQAHQPAIETPRDEGEPNSAVEYCFLVAMSMMHMDNYEETGNLDSLETAVQLGDAALAAIPGDINDRQAAIEGHDESLAALMSDIDMTLFMARMSKLRRAQYEQSGELADLDAAIEHGKVAMTATPEDDCCRANRLNNLSMLYNTRYERLGSLEDLEAAIEFDKAALTAIPRDHTDRATILSNLSNYFNLRYNKLGLIVDLNAAIEHAETTLELTPGDVVLLNNLSNRFNTRHKQLGALDDLQAAIKHLEAALTAMPEGDPNRAVVLENLSDRLKTRYDNLGTLSDLEATIKHAEAAMTATGDHFNDAALLSKLSHHFNTRYDRHGDLKDLDAAIKYIEAALRAGGDTGRATKLNDLSVFFTNRYDRLGFLRDLEAGIENAHAALAVVSNEHKDHLSVILGTLSTLLSKKYDRLGVLSDFEMAIEYAKAALKATPTGDPNLVARLNNLSTLLGIRHDNFGSLNDLEASIEYAQKALEAMIDGASRSLVLGTLANRLGTRYKGMGDLNDLDAAIKYEKEALEATPEGHPDRISQLHNLGSHLHKRYERLGEMDDIEVAIGYAQKALIAIPGDHPNRSVILGTLGGFLSTRYRRLGTLSDLEVAIEHSKASLDATPDDYPDRVARLNNLGEHLYYRYDRLGALVDLEAAIVYTQEALEVTPGDHPERISRLNNLSVFLNCRYDRLGRLSDLEAAVELSQEALAAFPENHPDLPTVLNTLSHCLSNRYEVLGELTDLNAAIKYGEASLEVTPRDHPDRAGRLNNLSNRLYMRYERSASEDPETGINDIDMAIQHSQAALAAAPTDHPNYTIFLFNLGNSLLARYAKSRSDKDFEGSFCSFLGAWNCHLAPPLRRVLAARKIIEHFPLRQTWEESSTLLEDAVRMMPKISLRSLEREDQQELLSKLYGLSSDAASFALQAGRGASHALRLLELGRGIITGFIIDHRSEVSDLRETDPNLFDSFTRLQAEINSKLIEPPLIESLQAPQESRDLNRAHDLSRRKQAMEEIDVTLSKIRRIPGYKGFLLPPSPETLMEMAKYGPIVVINTTSLRSDAIIVTPSSIKSLELPKLLYTKAKDLMQQMAKELVKGALRTYSKRNTKMNKLLLWLWEVAVEPVLEELGLTEPVDMEDNLTRVWWIGVGELTMAPFHAAGNHSSGSHRNTLSRVISSYIPTIKALSYARQKRLGIANKPLAAARLLLVTMPTTPGKAPLSKVEQEVKDIASIVEGPALKANSQGDTRTTVLKQPSAADVLEKLHLYDAVHFACHGTSDSNDPSNSSLILLDSSQPNGDKIDRLTAREISMSSASTKDAQLAYLSACCTADTSAARLADETIHLASAFQLAGFNHVVATMWQSKDEACMEVSRSFYSSLFDSEVSGNSQESDGGHRRVGIALHLAVKRTRDKRPDKPLIWAPFIHTGA